MKRQSLLRQYAAIAIFAVAFLAVGFLVRNSYYQLMMTLVLIWATMGLGWNMLSGYSGLISFGHAAFFGLGAYTVTIAFVKFGITPWLGVPLGVVVGTIAGVLIGIPTFRLRGHYFALAMLAYPLAMLYVFEWLGYQEVSLPMKRENPAAYMQFNDQRAYMVITMVIVVICMVISLHVERSRFGRSLLAIKQNLPAAEAAGINAARWRMYAMMLSAGDGGGRRRRLRGHPAGGDAAHRVRRAHLGAGADRHAVRRRRHVLGADHRLGDPDPAGRNAARRTRPYPARHPGRGVRRRHHRDHSGGAGRHLLESARPHHGAARRAAPAPRHLSSSRVRSPPRRRPRRAQRSARRSWSSTTCRARSAD